MNDEIRKMLDNTKDIQNGVYDIKKENERLKNENHQLKDYIENFYMVEIDSLKEVIENLKYANELSGKMRVQQERKDFNEIKQLKETNFKLMGRLTTYSEQLEKYERVLYGIGQMEDEMGNHLRAKDALGISQTKK